MQENKKPVVTEDQFKVLLDNDKKIQSSVNDTNSQLATDRQDIEGLKIDQGTIKKQQEVLLDNIADLKSQLKNIVKDEIKEQVAIVVKREFNKLILENPDKVFIIKKSFWDWVFRR